MHVKIIVIQTYIRSRNEYGAAMSCAYRVGIYVSNAELKVFENLLHACLGPIEFRHDINMVAAPREVNANLLHQIVRADHPHTSSSTHNVS